MLKIEIKTGNAAYRNEDDSLDVTELRENLYTISERLKNGYREGVVMDCNGNKVGKWSVD